MREVLLICGPPGSGKTTLARESGLEVFDRDDPQWKSEKQFRRAIAELKRRPGAQAAVIRSGATRSARASAAELIGATRTVVLTTPLDVCEQRVRARPRPRPPLAQQVEACREWFAQYEPDPYPAPLPW